MKSTLVAELAKKQVLKSEILEVLRNMYDHPWLKLKEEILDCLDKIDDEDKQQSFKKLEMALKKSPTGNEITRKEFLMTTEISNNSRDISLS